MRRVHSRVLDEEVLFVSDDAKVPVGDLVIYRESELKELVGRSSEALRRIHAAKKALNGKVVATRDRN